MSDLIANNVDTQIKDKIYTVRGLQVMLDRDLADLYKVETKVFNQAVKINISRFPQDFMFQLTKEELENWRPQFVTSNKDSICKDVSTHYVNLAYEYEVEETPDLPAEQHSEYQWFTIDKLLESKQVHKYVKDYFRN